MALRGRKPKSLAEKRITGTLRKHPVTPVVPEPPEGGLLCPLEVSDNPRAAAYWDMYLASTAPGHLVSVDAPLLARLCLALAYADEATAQVRALGLLVKAPQHRAADPVALGGDHEPADRDRPQAGRRVGAAAGAAQPGRHERSRPPAEMPRRSATSGASDRAADWLARGPARRCGSASVQAPSAGS